MMRGYPQLISRRPLIQPREPRISIVTAWLRNHCGLERLKSVSFSSVRAMGCPHSGQLASSVSPFRLYPQIAHGRSFSTTGEVSMHDDPNRDCHSKREEGGEFADASFKNQQVDLIEFGKCNRVHARGRRI